MHEEVLSTLLDCAGIEDLYGRLVNHRDQVSGDLLAAVSLVERMVTK